MSSLENIIIEYINKLQENEDLKIIPENIFIESKNNFENHKLKKLYSNYGWAHGIGVTAMTVGSVVGFFAGPIGLAVGSGIGGIVWSIASASSTVMDRCVISNKHLPDNEIKQYSIYKNIYYGKNKEFSRYFPQKFNDIYKDTIKFKINFQDAVKLFGEDKAYNFNGIINGEFIGYKLQKIINCTLIPTENLSNAIKIN